MSQIPRRRFQLTLHLDADDIPNMSGTLFNVLSAINAGAISDMEETKSTGCIWSLVTDKTITAESFKESLKTWRANDATNKD